jgi:O-antigen ligase
MIHVIWLLGTENFLEAKKVLGEAKYLLYPLLFAAVVDKQFISRVFAAFLLGMLISELWSYGIFFEILPPHYHDGLQGSPNDPTPVFHHTHYGFMLAVTLTLVLQRFFYEKYPLLLKVIATFFLISATINIFITAGRTGYVLYIFLLLTMFMLLFRKRIWTAGIAALLTICFTLALAYNFSQTFHKRVNQTINSIVAMYVHGNYQSSLGVRAAVIGSSRAFVLENWMFGVGTGDHLDELRKYIANKYPQYANMANSIQHLHNEYFSAITQFGVVGLAAFIYILFQLIVYPQEEKTVKNMQIVLAVAIALFGIIDIVVMGLGALLVIVTLVGLSLRNYPVANTQLSRFSGRQLLSYGVTIVCLELVSWVT